MSRSPESRIGLEKHLAALQGKGIFLKVKDPRSESSGIRVKLQGSHGTFDLTKWLNDKARTSVFLDSDTNSSTGYYLSGEIGINVKELEKPLEFILSLFHEMGHAYAENVKTSYVKWEDQGEVDTQAQAIQFGAQHEREAWEIALRLAIIVYQKCGWDIRELAGSKLNILDTITRNYFTYRDDEAAKNPDQLEQIHEAYDPYYLKLIVDQFWEKF